MHPYTPSGYWHMHVSDHCAVISHRVHRVNVDYMLLSYHCCLQVWAPDKKAPALELTWSPFGIFTCLLYVGATVYYFFVRFTFTMALGRTSWYV